MYSSHIIFIPGEVAIDPLAALQRGLQSLSRIPKPGVANGIKTVKNRLNDLPSIKSSLPVTARPVRYRKKFVETNDDKAKRIRRELLDCGATFYGLLKAEARYLPKIMHSGEHVEGVIYGQHGASSAMLVATSERVMYLDKKPMAELFDEISYDVISGIEFDIHLFFANVILHTPVRNYDFRFVNLHCAEIFAKLIESQKLERDKKESAPQKSQPILLDSNMAGYYWLPTDEEELRRLQGTLEI